MLYSSFPFFRNIFGRRLQKTATQDGILRRRPPGFLPPHLPTGPSPNSFLPDDHLLANLPCTRYWHYERRQKVKDLPPPGVPHWLRRFDWVVGWRHGWADTNQFPRHIYCHPNALDELLEFLRSGFPERKYGTILVVGGEDTLLSAQNSRTIYGLTMYFDKIFYEAFDQVLGGVDIMPIGLTEFYLRGYEDTVSATIYGTKEKDALLISAFGKFWPKLNERIDDRIKAIEFSRTSSFTTVGPFAQDKYFHELARHSFVICPRGNGVQAPKLAEAFLTCCTPVLTASPMASALVAKGAPVLVVEKWGDVSKDLLESHLPEFNDRALAFFEVISDMDKWWSFSFES